MIYKIFTQQTVRHDIGQSDQNKKPHVVLYPFIVPAERASIWKGAKGAWMSKIPDPARSIHEIRKELNRGAPSNF